MYLIHYVNGCSSGKPWYVSWFDDEGKGPDYGRFDNYPMAEKCQNKLESGDFPVKDCCSLDTLECSKFIAPKCVPCAPTPVCCGSKKKESTMCDYPTVNLDLNATERPSDLSTAREALVSRLLYVRHNKGSALRETFSMDAPDAPRTATEAIERIVAGKFQPIDKAKDEAKADAEGSYGYKWYRAIDWRTQPKDEAGYEAATEKLDAAYADAKLTIQVLPEVDGLKAFKDFQSFQAVTLN